MAFAAPKKLVFLHIPKTAGSSVGTWLDAQFKPHEIVTIYEGNAREQLQVALQNPEVRFIRGHFGLYEPLLAEIDNPNILIVTFLREPVSRVTSLYNHLQRRQIQSHVARMKSVKSMKDFLELKSDFNEQTRYLSGIEDKKTFQKNPDLAFEQALVNSAKFAFIGFTETVGEDFKKLCHLLGFKSKDLPHQNKGLSTIKQIVLHALYTHSISKVETLDINLYHQLKEKK